MKKLLVKSAIIAMVIFSALFFSGCGTYNSAPQSRNVTVYDYSYNNPIWAPAYYSGARYYYFPDIESYYDLANGEFIVLNRGQWIFVPSLAPYYSAYDLHSSYIVVLNVNVYQPWMHHHYYLRSYPRYYYIDYYDYSNIPYVRGFNENKKSAIYWNQNERQKARPWDDRNIRSNRNFTYSNADRRVQQETTKRVSLERSSAVNNTRSSATPNRTGTTTPTRTGTTTTRSTTATTRDANVQTPTRSTTTTRDANAQTRSTTTTRDANTQTRTTTTRSTTSNRNQEVNTSGRSSNTNYYGTQIGTPVRVEPQMRRNESTATRSGTTTRSSTGSRR